ncbi:hypothetical protein CR152_11905 [Massilia violaceinigra]|uniref:Cytochrome c domain-containing protein n=1 Tax=Massilia violaceinigra TaxID=2045208 RepID=A0A2D2DJJ0_9BURK|nr:hypothetical protein [Massilia violaceinigra]ATQ75144.1 hypothetical protein CR152_11905 [Massilia violaceinigra]
MTSYRTPILFALASWAIPLPGAAQVIPHGSYQLSCTHIMVHGDSLKASCRKLSGNHQMSTLDKVDACLNAIRQYGDIGNIDGNLVCLPDLPRPNPAFVFPKPETQLNQWIFSGKESPIHQHAWGLWAGLTQPVGTVDGAAVRAFETWTTPSSIIFRSAPQRPREDGKRGPIPRPTLDLHRPRQFQHGHRRPGKKAPLAPAAAPSAERPGAPSAAPDTAILVSVAYNPPAAQHAISHRLFYESTLKQLMAQGYTELPNFPTNAIAIKPVYKIIPKHSPRGIYTFPGWPGPDAAKPDTGFGEADWNSCVYVDTSRPLGISGNSNDIGCKGRTPANTFYLSDFIHSRVTHDNAAFLSAQLNRPVSAGDIAILIGMHVTTRENRMWTWQTYWWSANADRPFAPSSATIAGARPMAYLDSASRHYAMALAYSTVSPAQPITGGKNVGAPVYGYNPYLEAGFGPEVFADISRPINGTINANTGIQSNCMTCHNMAAYAPEPKPMMPYASDFYMSITDPIFDGTLRSDFSWTIVDMIVKTPAD